jgi:hypothetical protein
MPKEPFPTGGYQSTLITMAQTSLPTETHHIAKENA